MAKDKARGGTRSLGERVGALFEQVTPEEVERAGCDAEESEPEVDTRARSATEEAMRRRSKGKAD